ncbi:hypothetical protein [Kouleothrix sp.]|uniref:hypothetical protein n=1 Tax=Kouleothrix sp. TaxID=2779161 RepID=UPI00391D75CB
MAGAIPKPTIGTPESRRAASLAPTLAWLGAAPWLPALLLALATALALLAAYSSRPFVAIDIGDYLDRPFLPRTGDREDATADFYAPEVGPIGADEVASWPPTQAELSVPGRRSGTWQVTVVAAEGLDPNGLKNYTLSANGVRLWIARSSPAELVLLIPPELGAADTLRLRLEPGLVGDPIPPAGWVKQVKLAPARTYRWTSASSTISLPAIGRGDWVVRLTAALRHPDGQPLGAVIRANGTPVASLPDGDRRQIAVLVPAALVPDGDLTLEISSNTFKDPRNLGVLLYDVSVAPAGATPFLPPLKALLYALVIALSLQLCLARLTRNPALAALLALAVVLGGAWALAQARFPTAFMLPRLALLALWSVLLLLALERGVAWLFRRAGAPLSDRLLRGLLLVFFVGYWVKAGAMLYPYFVGIDMALQMQWARRIFSGEFWTFYGTGNPMDKRTMPTAEWGANPPVIPYSPWFHIFAGVFLLLPLPMVLAGHMFSALVDCSRVLLIALLGRKAGLNERDSLFASLLYAVTPATFLLHSWGNLPTTFGIWWTLVSTVFIVAAYRRLDRPWPFAILTLLLTITTLIYTVMAAFMMLFLALLVPALWLARRAERRGASAPGGAPAFVAGHPRESRSIAAIALAALAALLLATLIYYGQYIPLIVERTLPYFLGNGGGQKAGIQNHQPFLDYLADYIPRMGYLARPVMFGLWAPLALGLVGLARLRNRRLLALYGSWLLVALLFTIAGSRIAMVDKQIFYFIPAMALLSAPVIGWAWRRGLAGRVLVAAGYALTLAAALSFWIERVATIRQ